MNLTCRATALVLCLAPIAHAAAVDLGQVRFKAGEPHAGQSLLEAVESESWLRDFNAVSTTLKRHPDVHFELIGHAGADECEQEECGELALRRAVLAYRYLLDAGVDPRQLATLTSVGATQPIPDQPLLPELNRRVEINVAFDSLSPSIPAPTRVLTVAEVEAALGSLHGKEMSIRGYAHVGLEDNVLCPAPGEGGPVACLWLDLRLDGIGSDEDPERYAAAYADLRKSYDRKWVVVRGVLDARGSGHLGFAFGNVDVRTIQLEEAAE